jgi:hypothetical protein
MFVAERPGVQSVVGFAKSLLNACVIMPRPEEGVLLLGR